MPRSCPPPVQYFPATVQAHKARDKPENWRRPIAAQQHSAARETAAQRPRCCRDMDPKLSQH
eukprot:1740010-Alexandrium_andersonii.AAC.1